LKSWSAIQDLLEAKTLTASNLDRFISQSITINQQTKSDNIRQIANKKSNNKQSKDQQIITFEEFQQFFALIEDILPSGDDDDEDEDEEDEDDETAEERSEEEVQSLYTELKGKVSRYSIN
jgi:hypothetical protein